MMLEMDLQSGTLRLNVEPHEVEAGKDLFNHAIESIGPFLRGIGPVVTATRPTKLLSFAFDAYLAELQNSGEHRSVTITPFVK